MKAYEHFEDPEWDGELLEPEAPQPRPKLVGGEDNKTGDDRPSKAVTMNKSRTRRSKSSSPTVRNASFST
jgi:hypothetical protein